LKTKILTEKKMPHAGDEFLREQLLDRRQRLATTTLASGDVAVLRTLVAEVDEALDRMEKGTYGLCDVCHGPIEKPRLIADPLVRVCLDDLSAPQRRALEEDLLLAAKIQQALLPARDLALHGWQVHYRYEPVGPVSGDYCDLIVGDNDSGDIFFLLGDVSGKGVAASMLMTQLHAMFRSLITVGLPLDRLMAMANSIFCGSNTAGQYATLVCGRAAHSGTVELSSAGHVPVLLVRDAEVTRVESTGFPLGMFGGSRFDVHRLQLAPGETLLLYTDGVTEARGASQSEYGVERLTRFARERRGLAPQGLAAACLTDVDAFRGGASRTDDVTLMVLRRA
jgi:sigma-B regulation protein RsbU (phosphoserine phosphatase)